MRLKSYLATKDENELTVEQAFRLAQAHDVLADRSSARRVASMALQKWPEEMRLRVLVGKLAIGEYDRISNIESAKVSQRMKFLQEAMKSGAVDAELSVRLADLYTKRSTSPAAASTVKALLLAPESPAFVFFQFGTQAALEGDTTTARKFLKRTLRINPDDANALNNIAWLMANSQPKDLRTAIKAANKALLYEPRNFHFRETRGQIHLAREEWQMAIQDLEFALPYLGTEKAKTVRQSLSAAYEALGKTRPGY